MKVTLDLDELLRNGDITQAEHDKLGRLAAATTGSLAFNLLVGFGIVAVAAAALALVPTAITAIVIGLCLLLAGMLLHRASLAQWQLLANICILVGALMAGGGLIAGDDGSLQSMLTVTVAFAVIAAFSRSSLMAVLATLMLAGCIGSRTDYFHASYGLEIQKPIYTIVLFSLLAAGLHRLSAAIPAAYLKITEAATRTSVFLVNFGFWVGSLWGDHIGRGYAADPTLAKGYISAPVFAVLWALVLLATGIWAWRRNRRWVLNTVAVFAAIDLYTQWFENLDANAGSLLFAGLVALAAALGLSHINAAMRQRTASAE